METIKLYDNDSYLTDFAATVTDCKPVGDKYIIVLDKTAFFPESGGQTGDTGKIDDAVITDTQTENGIIFHKADRTVKIGKTVNCTVDFKTRFDKMQNHSGEHIISGTAHQLYGCDNVGFHLSNDTMTLDLNMPLDNTQIANIEFLANEAVQKNVPVKILFPNKSELGNMQYRSKKEIDGKVRIVEIEGYDVCACCAPHVKRTGEIGIIKICGYEKHKDGVRLFVKCGMRALSDYAQKQISAEKISALLCAKQSEIAAAVSGLCEQNKQLLFEIKRKNREILLEKVNAVGTKQNMLVLFCEDMPMDDIRFAVNNAKQHCETAAIFCKGTDNYTFICASDIKDMTVLADKMRKNLNAKCGGNADMIQGSVYATSDAIYDFFKLGY